MCATHEWDSVQSWYQLVSRIVNTVHAVVHCTQLQPILRYHLYFQHYNFLAEYVSLPTACTFPKLVTTTSVHVSLARWHSTIFSRKIFCLELHSSPHLLRPYCCQESVPTLERWPLMRGRSKYSDTGAANILWPCYSVWSLLRLATKRGITLYRYLVYISTWNIFWQDRSSQPINSNNQLQTRTPGR